MSIVGENAGGLGGMAELDLEKILGEFPDETLVYMSEKMLIGMDDEKRESEYKCFKVRHFGCTNWKSGTIWLGFGNQLFLSSKCLKFAGAQDDRVTGLTVQ